MCLGIPGQIVDVKEGALRTGRVSFSGAVRSVCLEYVPEARVGDYVVVHAGFAIARLDERQAELTLQHLDEALAADQSDAETGAS